MGSTFDAIFAFFFKYPPRVFERGEFSTAPVVEPLWLAALAVVGLMVVVFAYRNVRMVAARDRVVLGILRAAVVLLVVACLFRPGLVIASAVPQRNVLAILLDDSRSMRIADGESPETRLQAVQRTFADTSSLMRALSEKFALRVFRFAGDARPVANASALTAAGTRSDLATALQGAREELGGLPLAGVVMVSDGADNGGGAHNDALLALRAGRVPVYTVGVGRERFARDVAIDRVSAPQRVLAGGAFFIEADLRASGIGGQQVTVVAEADGRILTTETVTIDGKQEITRARLRVPPIEQGNHRLTVRVRDLNDERIVENNAWHGVVQVRRGPDRILYVEGEPRPEFAFLRRGVAADSGLQVAGLMRSAERKYLRLGVRDSLELITGFPTTREELFQFRAIILGSIEASFFTADQLRMLSEFVSQRGGGLLALGGRASLGEGDYAGTPLAEVLPVTLTRVDADPEAPALEVNVRPTTAGLSHAALQLRESAGASRARWDSLPPLTTVNRVGALRAGATLLLTGRPSSGGSDVPVLATQRYGRGMSAVLSVQDSWLWKMHHDIAVDDDTHQTFWRQLLRWLVDGVPDQVEVTATPSRVAPGERVTLRAHVTNGAFIDVNDATATATVTAPGGRTREMPLEWSLSSDGNYVTQFEADTSGMYVVQVQARVNGGRDTVVSAPAAFVADEGGADLARAELGAGLLRRIASETGGLYRSLDDAGRLADDVMYTESGVTVREARDLWDMPAVFLVLALLLSAEWGYRRWRGLA